MGLNLFKASKCAIDSYERPIGNPNPKRFKIQRHRGFKGTGAQWTVVEVVYPDAKNYEGRKIMVYHADMKTIRAQPALDPHFCDDASHLAPFARFEPTPEGWNEACGFAANMSRR